MSWYMTICHLICVCESLCQHWCALCVSFTPSKARRWTAETVCENEIMQNIIKTFIFLIQIYLKLNMRNNDEDVTAYESLTHSLSPRRSEWHPFFISCYREYLCVCFWDVFHFFFGNSSWVRGLRSSKRDLKISSFSTWWMISDAF